MSFSKSLLRTGVGAGLFFGIKYFLGLKKFQDTL